MTSELMNTFFMSIASLCLIAVEGNTQHSYKNILKAGFSESVLRENYTLK